MKVWFLLCGAAAGIGGRALLFPVQPTALGGATKRTFSARD